MEKHGNGDESAPLTAKRPSQAAAQEEKLARALKRNLQRRKQAQTGTQERTET